MKKLVAKKQTTRLVALLFVVTLLFPVLTTPVGAAAPKHARIHPQLGKLAADNPNQNVRVIVQGDNSTGGLSSKLDRHGAKDKRSLPTIKGVTAEMTAAEAQNLASEPGIESVTIDAPMVSTVIVDQLATDYPLSVDAPGVWNRSTPFTGDGVTVAVVDSGIQDTSHDFQDPATKKSRVVANVRYSRDDLKRPWRTDAQDLYGHGTHVAGIIASNGLASRGKYIGIAPEANLVNVKASDQKGLAYVSDVIAALQWVVENCDVYNIRVVNLSMVQQVPDSYLTSPLDAAVEMTWLSGIVVVVSAGNLGPDTAFYPPANDPFVITVGATDTNGTPNITDDVIPDWSSYGLTQDGFAKPDVVAPGRRIVSNLASHSTFLGRLLRDRIVDERYIRLSGTSQAAPVVSGIVALALQAHTDWTPDQVKSAILTTSRPLASPGSGSGEVDAAAVVSDLTPGYANKGLALNLGVAEATGNVLYDSTTWNSTTWNSTTWNSTTWNSTTWNSTTWNSTTWNSTTWNSTTWNSNVLLD